MTCPNIKKDLFVLITPKIPNYYWKILVSYFIKQIYSILFMSETTNQKIAEIYYQEAGYGSLASTYQDVKKKYPDITYKEVRDWYRKTLSTM